MPTGTLSKEALETKYLLDVSWRCSTIDFLGLPSFQDDRPVSLEQLYVSTRLTWEAELKSRVLLSSALRQSRRLVVLGDPGSGKSILLQSVAYSFARTDPAPLARMLGPHVPLLVLLRDYATGRWQQPIDMLRDFVAGLDAEIRQEASP